MSRKSIDRICIGAYFNIVCIEEQGAFLLETLQIAGITGRFANHRTPIVSLSVVCNICVTIPSSYFILILDHIHISIFICCDLGKSHVLG